MTGQKFAETSPFTPGYGRSPMVFGGHQKELVELTEVFRTLDFGENQTVLVSGLRGSGKTSMLARLQDAARENGWLVISDDANSGLMDRVMDSTVPRLLGCLSRTVRGRLTNLGIWRFSAAWEYTDRYREVAPLLRRDLIALSQALTGPRHSGGILITIDEVSSGKVRLRELSRFALEISHAISEGANIMLVLAGIRIDLDALLDHEHTTFLRRSRELGFQRLTPSETRYVLSESIRIGGKTIADDALTLLVGVSQGYPYLVQLAGDFAWRASGERAIVTIADARASYRRAIAAVERRVISRVYRDLSEGDQQFVHAMAVDEGHSSIADIAVRLRASDQYVQVYARRLVESGYVQSEDPDHVSFSLPYLREYVRSLSHGGVIAGHDRFDDGWEDFPPPTPKSV